MENKTSFVLYVDTIHVVNKLPDEYAGKLFKLILAYVNDESPVTNDPLLEIAFEPIKQQLKRDLKKWNSIRQKRSEAGKIGGRKNGKLAKKQSNQANDSFDKQNQANDSFEKQSESNESVSVNVNVNVNDNVINKNQSKIDHVVSELLSYFNTTFRKKSKIVSQKVVKAYLNRIKEGYSIDDIKCAMKNASMDSFHKENGFKHCTMEFFSRSEKIDKFVTITTSNNSPRYIPTK